MPQYTQQWTWQEAFSKFGFNDGDSWTGTYLVVDFLNSEGYEAECELWGCHNVCISELRDKNGVSLLPDKDASGDDSLGYADPENYLPESLVKKLDNHFNDDYSVCK